MSAAAEQKLKPNEYRCAVCRSVYEKGWSDEEASAELAYTFAVSTDDCDLVCDDCYKAIGLGE